MATEMHRLVVIGIPLDKVSISHPAPDYPQNASTWHINGKVELEVEVRDGRILVVKILSGPPPLAYSAKRWIAWRWTFKPEVSGVFTIPILYRTAGAAG
jgi:hypothetical protein